MGVIIKHSFRKQYPMFDNDVTLLFHIETQLSP